jgi:hypothetical protein
MTSVSTRFFGQPRLTKPIFKMKRFPAKKEVGGTFRISAFRLPKAEI